MSSTSGKTLGFEVHVLRKGRWEIHATYPAEQRRIATRDAKSLDKISTISGARVIREFQDPKLTAPGDQVIFVSPKLERQMQAEKKSLEEVAEPGMTMEATGGVTDPEERGNVTRGGGDASAASNARTAERGGEPDYDDEEAQAHGFATKPVSAVALLVRLGAVSVVSLVIASTIVGVMSILMTKIDTLAQMTTQSSRNNILFATFIIAFLLSAFPMAIKYVGRLSAHAAIPAARRRQQKAQGRRRNPRLAPRAPDIAAITAQAGEVAARADGPKGLSLEAVRDMAGRLAEVLSAGVSLQPKSYMADLPQMADLMSEPARAAVQDLQGFLQESQDAASETQGVMDNVTRFGISLFIAGASDAMAAKASLSDKDRAATLAHAIQSLGFGRNQAGNFAEKHDQYLLADPRYLKIYQQGREAMVLAQDKNPAAPKMLGHALEEWNAPKETTFQNHDRTVAVMFTDMVGSTGMTAELGDHGAQEVVRLHNRIVRDALTVFKGREVKHTGDGIMASFENASDAIEGAIAIQEAVQEQHDLDPSQPLKVKIGINAGEAILEDDDLFGSTVQVAARIVDKAQAGEILISSITRGLCAGKKLPCKDRGAAAMKGVPEPVVMHEVLWGAEAEAFLATEEQKAEVEVEAEAKEEAEPELTPPPKRPRRSSGAQSASTPAAKESPEASKNGAA